MSVLEAARKQTYARLSWDEWYELAKEYYSFEHHLKIPVNYKTREGYLLGRWIERQRSAYHQKGVYKIDARKIYLLNQIGMIWTLGVRRKWEIGYQYCEEYYLEFGNIDIPKNMIYKKMPLGEWLLYQRKCYRLKKISKWKCEKLESLGIKWQIRHRRNERENKIK